MVTDRQVRKLMKLLNQEEKLSLFCGEGDGCHFSES